MLQIHLLVAIFTRQRKMILFVMTISNTGESVARKICGRLYSEDRPTLRRTCSFAYMIVFDFREGAGGGVI